MLLSYVCRLSHRHLQCFGHLSTSAHASFDLHALVFELCAGVWGGGDGGGGGVMTSMRLRVVFSFSFGGLLLRGCGAVCRTRFGGPFRILVA